MILQHIESEGALPQWKGLPPGPEEVTTFPQKWWYWSRWR